LTPIAGDDELKAEFNQRSNEFDAAEAWRTRGTSLADIALANMDKERARDLAMPYNSLQGQHCGRQLEESLDEFLNRLPPSTSIASAELPWIRVANTYASRHECAECEDSTVSGLSERFQDICDELLKHLEEQTIKWKIDMESKPAHMLNRAINKMRSETVDQIRKHAIEFNVKTGKVRNPCLALKRPPLSSYLPTVP